MPRQRKGVKTALDPFRIMIIQDLLAALEAGFFFFLEQLVLFRRQHFNLAARLFNSGNSAFGGAGDDNRRLAFQSARIQKANAVACAADNAGFDQHSRVDGLGSRDFFAVNGLLDGSQCNFSKHLAAVIPETALGHAPVKGHLTAFKTLQRHAAAGLLAFNAATAGFSLAAADTAPHRHTSLAGAGIVS